MPSTQLVGILNLTPDSFSDGGRYASAEVALEAALCMAKDGAAVIDVGAESTRPDATPLTHEQEWARLESVLPALCNALAGKAQVSLDTRHAATARKALAVGVDWINDVSGLTSDEMLEVLASSPCRIVAMHSLTIPADLACTLPHECDAVDAMADFAKAILAKTAVHGIARGRLILDPGVGFGKTAEQSLALLKRVQELEVLGLPLMIGHSRKSFLKPFTQDYLRERDDATLILSGILAHSGVAYLRVHDVARHRLLFAVQEVLGA